MYGVLMAAHVMKELINGMKLIVLSGKRRLSHAKRMRYFVAGALLNFVALFTLFVSTIYNQVRLCALCVGSATLPVT